MTLLDLCRLLKRYLVLVIALPIVCAGACAVYCTLSGGTTSYTATSRIIANSQISGVSGLAASEARQVTQEYEEFETVKLVASVKADTATNTIIVTVSGSDEDLCLESADSIAKKAAETAKMFYRESNESISVAMPFSAQVELASSEGATSSGGINWKYVLVALLAGLFVAICIVVIIDIVKRPVKSVEGVQDAVELPVLEILPVADNGKRLLANIRFAAKKDDLHSVCVIPVGEGAADEETIGTLMAAAQAEGKDVRSGSELQDGADMTVIHCVSLAQDMKAAYTSRAADATVLVVCQWSDSLTALESAVAELKLAETSLVGIIFAKENK